VKKITSFPVGVPCLEAPSN